MAEFVKVMEIAARVCQSTTNGGSCHGCLLCVDDGEHYCYFGSMDELATNWQEIERRLLAWDAAHPAHPPTWRQWQRMLSDDDSRIEEFCPQFLLGEERYPCSAGSCTACLNCPIPEETAARLGIWPTKEEKQCE